MTWWQTVLLGGGAVLAMLALYGMHRGLVMLERHGLMYYLRRPEGGGGSSAWLPLDELANPNVRHVIEVQEQHRPAIDNKGGEPPGELQPPLTP